MHREKTQSFFDLAEYKEETKSGEQLLDEMKIILDGFFEKKQRAAHRIAESARDLHDKLYHVRERDYLSQLKINSSSHLSWRKSDGSL
ncbi:unnamed protein product, partial [Rotaria sp. Silwood1]